MDKILAEFRKSGKPAFRTREYSAFIGKKGYARLVLHRLKERGEISRVRNGWWAFPDSVPEAVACEMSKPAYISFHSALYIHGLTTQMPRMIQLAVARNAKKYSAMGIEVREYRVKRENFNGFYRKDNIMIATPEKAVADCLQIPRSCPEMVVAEAIAKSDAKKIMDILSAPAKRRMLKVIKDAGQE
jgi:predicted transcriptional regulator of viral defense system